MNNLKIQNVITSYSIHYTKLYEKDYGFNFYNDILSTSKQYLEKNPIEVNNFKDASLKGWEYAFSNIDETVDILYSKYNTLNKTKEALKYEALELKKLASYNFV